MNDKIHKLTPSVIHWIYLCNYVMRGNWKILRCSHLFIFQSKDKLELTDKLQHEQHICNEQGERLAKQEEELSDLR